MQNKKKQKTKAIKHQGVKSFLVNILENPNCLTEIQMNSQDFVKRSKLSQTNKDILIGSNSDKIKKLIHTATIKGLKVSLSKYSKENLAKVEASKAMIWGVGAKLIFGVEASEIKFKTLSKASEVKKKLSEKHPIQVKF